MNVPKSMIAVALMALQSAALAQATAPDPNCPLKGLVEKSTLAGGRVAIRSVEKAGPQDCRGPGDCTPRPAVEAAVRCSGWFGSATKACAASGQSAGRNQPSEVRNKTISVDFALQSI